VIKLHTRRPAVVFLVVKEKQAMIKNSTILAKSVLALAVLGNAGGSLAQTQAGRNTHDISTQNTHDISTGDKKRVERFESQVDDFRERLKIPGMSAVIIKDQKILWAKGFGFADLEKRIPATPDTLFHLASVTKTFAAILIMQLVEQGKLNLDEPMSHYSTDFKDDSVKIKHLLSHTSSGTPGERFRYDGNRYDYLTAVNEKKTGKRFGELVVTTFFDPLGMSNSVPYHHIVVDADKWTAELGRNTSIATRRASRRWPSLMPTTAVARSFTRVIRLPISSGRRLVCSRPYGTWRSTTSR
jgi:CubicO group peptidase (beta-lactamase class C family)